MKARAGFGARMQISILALAVMTWPSAGRCEEDPIKVGILHSQTGATARSEVAVADTIRMLIKQQNAKGGVLGRKLEPVIVDAKSDDDVFRAAAEKMLIEEKVSVVFGGWTSSSRRSMLPVFEKHNGILFYPAQFEGQESSRNIFYTGAVPNQQMFPALRYLVSKQGGSIKRWFLLGTDQVYSHTANGIVEAYLRNTGVADEDIMIRYVPYSGAPWEVVVGEIRNFAALGRKTAVISTINGESNLGFFQEFGAQEISAASVPVMSFTVGERELASMPSRLLEGHMATWSYFSLGNSPQNAGFVNSWREFTQKLNETPNDQMEAAAIGFRMWTQAAEQAGTVDVNAVRQAMYGQKVSAPSGFEVAMQGNHIVSKPAMIARVNAEGVFEVVWRSQTAISADAWSKYLPATARLTADWTFPWICGGCIEPTVRD
jgi:urea transport system substrate-binding protein